MNLLNCMNITDAGVGKLAEGCRGLTTINLRYNSKITDAGIGKMTSINLRNCSKITDAGVGSKLAEGCRVYP